MCSLEDTSLRWSDTELAGVRSSRGEWLRRNTVNKEAYAPLCTNLSVLKSSLLALGYVGYWQAFSEAWFCSLSTSTQLRTRSEKAGSYSWRPEGCKRTAPLAALQPHAIDKALSGGRVLTLVGDSVTDQQFLSLFCLLGSVVDRTSLNGSRAFSLVGGGRVQHLRTDFLVDSRHALTSGILNLTLLRQKDGTYHYRSTRIDEAWAPRLRYGSKSSADVLLLSTGYHWPEFGLNALRFASLMHQVLEQLKSAGFAGQILYRTLFAPGCGDEPNNNRTSFLPPSAPHGWARYREYDQEAAALAHPYVSTSGKPLWSILNVSVSTSKRVDGHCGECHARLPGGSKAHDCLHYCLMPGGPVDLWNAALIGALEAKDAL